MTPSGSGSQHGICVQARHEPCNYCGEQPEQPCDTGCGGAVHLCRVCLAAKHGRLTMRDAVSVIAETATSDRDGMFAGWSLVFDTAAVTP